MRVKMRMGFRKTELINEGRGRTCDYMQYIEICIYHMNIDIDRNTYIYINIYLHVYMYM